MTMKLQAPFNKDGALITELSLDFEKLNGYDIIECEQQARSMGETKPNPLFSSLGLSIIAARASGHIPDDIMRLKAQDFLMVTTMVSNFLYGWVLPTLMPSDTSGENS